jgi:hypothetical protein
VEQGLETYTFPAARPSPGPLDWIWEPFTRSERSVLPLIVGRIASLLERAPVESAPRERLGFDPRLALPLLAIVNKQDAWRLTEELPKETKQTFARAFGKAIGWRVLKKGATAKEARAQFVGMLLHVTQASKWWLCFLNGLTPEMQFEFLNGLYFGPSPRRWDWLALRTPGKHARWIPAAIQGRPLKRSESASEQTPASRQNGTSQTMRTDSGSRRPGSGPFRAGMRTGANP